MAVHGEVEPAELVAREGIGAALQHDDRRPKHFKHARDNGLEDALVRVVRDAVLKRDVHRVALALSVPPIILGTRARKVLPELVEGARHDAVRGVERLLDAVAVVAVDVDVEDARVGEQELDDAEDDVVDVAEAGGLALLAVLLAMIVYAFVLRRKKLKGRQGRPLVYRGYVNDNDSMSPGLVRARGWVQLEG